MFRSVFALLLIATAAHGAPNEDYWGSPPSVDHARAAELVAEEKYQEALVILVELADKSPGDADIFNLLGFSYRKTGDLKQARTHYERALRLDPDHLSALEYQGELYLMLGDAAAAKANLARLDTLCPSGCEERDELAEAIAAAGG